MTTITASTSTFHPDTIPTIDALGAAKRLALSATHAAGSLAHAAIDTASRPTTHRGAFEAWACVAFAAAGITLHTLIG